MYTFTITVGDKIELRLRLPDGSYSSFFFSSQIQDILSENEFLIFPLTKNLDIWPGRIFQLTVIRKTQVYTSAVKVEDIIRDDARSFLRLLVLEDFRRKQRREFYRLNVSLKTEISEHGKYRTVNLSGNGMAFLSDKKFEEGEELTGTINLKGNVVGMSGVVVRSIDNLDGKHHISVEFRDLEKGVQNEIVKFIYREQRIMMGKGVLLSL
mgnify:CR=1 FL=1